MYFTIRYILSKVNVSEGHDHENVKEVCFHILLDCPFVVTTCPLHMYTDMCSLHMYLRDVKQFVLLCKRLLELLVIDLTLFLYFNVT